MFDSNFQQADSWVAVGCSNYDTCTHVEGSLPNITSQIYRYEMFTAFHRCITWVNNCFSYLFTAFVLPLLCILSSVSYFTYLLTHLLYRRGLSLSWAKASPLSWSIKVDNSHDSHSREIFRFRRFYNNSDKITFYDETNFCFKYWKIQYMEQ